MEDQPKDGKTDLGIVWVQTVGERDKVYLTHNNLLAFECICSTTRPAQISINPKFLAYSKSQWVEVGSVYLAWKREHMPGFKLPRHSGLTRDGHQHPWRKKLPPQQTNRP